MNLVLLSSCSWGVFPFLLVGGQALLDPARRKFDCGRNKHELNSERIVLHAVALLTQSSANCQSERCVQAQSVFYVKWILAF